MPTLSRFNSQCINKYTEITLLWFFTKIYTKLLLSNRLPLLSTTINVTNLLSKKKTIFQQQIGTNSTDKKMYYFTEFENFTKISQAYQPLFQGVV